MAHGAGKIGRCLSHGHLRPGACPRIEFNGGGMHEGVPFGLRKLQGGVDQLIHRIHGDLFAPAAQLHPSIVDDEL